MEFTAPTFLLASSLMSGLTLCGSRHAPCRTAGLVMLLLLALWDIAASVEW